jgi:hypothetical protein
MFDYSERSEAIVVQLEKPVGPSKGKRRLRSSREEGHDCHKNGGTCLKSSFEISCTPRQELRITASSAIEFLKGRNRYEVLRGCC